MKKKYIVLALFAILLLSNAPQSLNLFINQSPFVQGADEPTVPWLDSAWSYRRAITVDNTLNGNSLTDYQVRVNVTFASTMKSNFDDLRFTSGDGVTLIPCWIESYTSAVSAVVWIKVPSVAASSTTTIYMYYGNPNAASYSSGKATFDFFDDFEEGPIAAWTDKQPIPHNTADGTAAVYNGKLYVFGGYENTGTDILKIAYEYDPATDTWTRKTDMPTARWGAIAVQYSGKIYVFGGQTNSVITGIAQNTIKYSGNPLTTIPQYGADGSVHPDVIYFPDGQDGYKYWMMYTPYPPQSKENPSIARSNDGITWTADGINNPIIPAGTPGTFNDLENPDPDFLYVPDYNKWFMVWDPGDQATNSRKIALAYSSDGKTWTQYNGASINGNTDPIIMSGDDAYGQPWERSGSVSKLSCPTLFYENGVFYLYYVEEASGNNRGATGLATFTWNNQANSIQNFARNPNNPIINLPGDAELMGGIGHLDVAKSPDNSDYWLYGVRQIVGSASSYELVLLTSTDKTTWHYRGTVLETGPAGAWDSTQIYRSCPMVDINGKIVLFNNTYRLYYSGWNANTIPQIGFATVSPYYGVLGNPYAGNNNYWGGTVQLSRFLFNGSTGTYSGSITVFFSSVAGSSNNRAVVGIYDQNLAKVAESTEVTGLSTGWQTFNLTGTFTLTNNSIYYLVSHAPTDNNGKLISGAQNQGSWNTQTYTGTLPASLAPISGQEDSAYAIYCTYTNATMSKATEIAPYPAPHTNEAYNPSTDTWETKTDIPAEISYQGLMGALYGNEIHLFYKNYHYVYFPANDSYARRADVPTWRTWGTCAVVDNKIYVIGGYAYSPPAGASNVNEVYDPATDTWQTKNPLPASLIGITRENPVINGKIYVTHGLDALAGNFHAETYVYNPAADTWEQKQTAHHLRDGTACGVISGKLYVVGGRADLPGPYGLDYNEVYEPELDTQWTLSNTTNVYVDSAAKYQGNYGLLINDNSTTVSQYAEHLLGADQRIVDLDSQMTDALGTGASQPNGKVLLVDPSLENSGTLCFYNDAGTPRFGWYTGTYTPLQSASWNTWYRISIVSAGSNSKVIINGTPYSVTTGSVSDRIRLDTTSAEESRAYFDQIRVRKYTAVEPTITIGNEESNTPVQYTLTVYIVGQGTVSPGNTTHLAGTNVNLNAFNAAGWSFAGWSGDAQGTQNTTLTMNSNKIVTATFTQNLLNWTQTTTADFNLGSTDNTVVTTIGQSDGDVVLATTSGTGTTTFNDNFNDGTLDPSWTTDTSPLTPQWIKIDLGTVYSINTIKVYQSNFPLYYTKDYQIQTSTDDNTYTAAASNTLPNTINSMQTSTFTAVNARYVKIQISSYYAAGISQGLNEVEVFQAGDPNTNIALNKAATASSYWPSSNYTPAHVVDGLKGTTQDTSPYPWLCADDAKAISDTVAEASGSLQINAAENTYAHIQRTLNLPSNTQNVTVTARMQVSDAGYSWCPKLVLYWAPGDWCGLGLVNNNFVTNVNVYATQSEGFAGYSGATPNTYYYLKIVLNSTSIQFSESSDGSNWQVLRTVERPASYSTPPSMLIVGKGYGNGGYMQGGYTYGNPDLDNNYPPMTGSMDTASIDDLSFIAYSQGQSQYVSSGVFTSNVYDAMSSVSWSNIYWTANLPQGTSLAVQTRSGNSQTPDGTWSSWSTAYPSSGAVISSPNSRYIQYRVTLQTSDTSVTPVLQSITITASHDTTYTVSVTILPSASAGTVTPNATGPYHYGDIVVLTETPNSGYTFSGWSGDGTGSGTTRTVTVTENMAVTATFIQNTYSVSVTVLPTSSAGTVTPNASGPYHYGDVVVLTETPNTGYSFSGWSGAGSGTGTTRTVTVTGNMAVTATFVESQTLTWTQTSLADFNSGTKSNVVVTAIGQSDGDVVLATTSGTGTTTFNDNFNDGTLDPSWTTDTSPLTPQWIKIDLGTVYSINTIKVYQSNFPLYYTKDYQIQLSTDDATYTAVSAGTLPNTINSMQTNAFSATNARYVKIVIQSYYSTGISEGLNEVEIFQAGDPNTNIALNKPATASSEWPSTNYTASHAVDGLKGTTQDTSPYPWLCADDAKAVSDTIAETSGALQISAAENTYAHIQRTLNLPSSTQNITVTARMQVSDNAGYSWCPKIALYWASGDWCSIGISNSQFITTVDVFSTQTEGYIAYSGAVPNTYYYLRIIINSTSIEFSESSNGTTWQVLRTANRPASYSTQPSMLIAGKGYGNGGYLEGGYTYPNEDLDNNYPPATGNMGTCSIDDLSFTAYNQDQGSQQYMSNGVFTSSVFDASSTASWQNIYWTANLPQGTSISIQTRSGNTLTPDGTWSSWSTAYAASGATVASPSNRYIQYRVTLQTTDATVTPIIQSISISYHIN